MLTSEQEEGPFYVEDERIRKVIRSGKAGIPLHLRVRVIDTGDCTPVARAAVDV